MHNSLDASAPDILLEYWIEHVSFGLPYVMLHSLLGYSTGVFQALQLVVIAAFSAVDEPLAPCMLVHFLKI